ncbi:MAG: hypothetical protein IJ864_04045 [Alphaproteobacteria bacterium]|nr:hypothetical protein [Alphaproteobacteria bacterium]
MLINKFFILAFITVLTSIAQAQQNTEEKKIYRIPEDIRCQKNYCTDKANNPITGTMHKYKNGVIIREYNTVNGYLHGLNRSFYENGKLQTERQYAKGKLNGTVNEYATDGQLKAIYTYVDGKKEGLSTQIGSGYIFKATYKNDQLNGDAAIWEMNNSIPIYKLKIKNNTIISGDYFYGDNQNKELDTIIIEGINYKCLAPRITYVESSCAVEINKTADLIANRTSLEEECNGDWFAAKRRELALYLKACKCIDLKNNIEKLKSKAYSNIDDKNNLSTLQNNYSMHCNKEY